ncbi:MAG: hypothetical protein K9J06_02800 [Flavobacteriales bacterium]|nr:hypothetical protein [Flavobacteriales bacterium]
MSEKMERISRSGYQRISALTTKAHEGLSQRRTNFVSREDAKKQRAVNRKSSIVNRSSQILFSLVPIVLLLLISSSVIAQHRRIDWDLLAKVEWSEKYSEEHDEVFYYPKFATEVLAVNGQPVQIKGYVIPVDVETGYFVLSANPFASCFFCGQAGPESILELQMKAGGKRFKTDDVVSFKGTLRLNYEDLMHCNYILEEAEVVK